MVLEQIEHLQVQKKKKFDTSFIHNTKKNIYSEWATDLCMKCQTVKLLGKKENIRKVFRTGVSQRILRLDTKSIVHTRKN